MTFPPTTTLEAARGYITAGLSVFPVQSKHEIPLKWGAYKSESGRKATSPELEDWYGRDRGYGIGIAHGVISGNSFAIDHDTPGAYPELVTVCTALGMLPLLNSLVRVETPSGGVHLYGRCAEPVGKNDKLAHYPQPVDSAEVEVMTEAERKREGIRRDESGQWFQIKTKIETRGEGGYTVAPGSPASVHPTGKLYRLVSGSFDALPVLSGDDYVRLLDAARSLTEWAEPAVAPKPAPTPKNLGKGETHKSPGQDYNERINQDELVAHLVQNGYAIVGRRHGPHGEVVDFARPGKAAREGHGLTLGYVAPGVLHCFTSNDSNFDNGRAYDPFGQYARLECRGDFSEAAKRLAAKGYGERVLSIPLQIGSGSVTIEAGPPSKERAKQGLPQYEMTADSGTFCNRRTEDGMKRVQLANFTAHIVQDTIEDDGAEAKRRFTIEAALPGQSPSLFDVSASEFGGMEWAIDRLGSRALLAPGRGTKDHARAAIQTLSDAKERRVHTHTGWVKQGDAWHYCHGGETGTIGASVIEEDGAATLPGCESVHDGQEIAVTLSGSLSRFALPTAPTVERLTESILAILQFWQLGTADVVLPVAIAPFRAVLGACDFSLFVAGPTGVFKSQIAALAQQHFGKEMNSRNMPADWSSTDNYLEGLAFVAKDALLVIDEFVPRGAVTERERAHAKADRVLRAQGNGSAKGRMRADGSLRPAKPPRGLILATGEEVPSGQSLRARLLVLEVSSGDIPAPALTECQRDAASGLYAECMAAYLTWLAPRYAQLHEGLACEVEALRGKLPATALPHARTAEIVCHLSAGARHFLHFCVDVDAIPKDEAERLFKHVWKTLCAVCNRQGNLQKENEPAGRFIELLAAALSAGRCHVASLQGHEPFQEGPRNWGWRSPGPVTLGGEAFEWRPQGDCIGYVDGENLYLLPDAAYSAASRLTHESGDSVSVRPKTLSKRLHEKGMLATVGVDGLTIQVQAVGRRVRAWHVRTKLVQGDTE